MRYIVISLLSKNILSFCLVVIALAVGSYCFFIFIMAWSDTDITALVSLRHRTQGRNFFAKII